MEKSPFLMGKLASFRLGHGFNFEITRGYSVTGRSTGYNQRAVTGASWDVVGLVRAVNGVR